MVIFSIIVLLAVFALFPSDKTTKTSREERLMAASENGELEALVQGLEEEYLQNPHNLDLLRTKIEAMLYARDGQYSEELLEACRRLAAQSTDLGWFEQYFYSAAPQVREQAVIVAQRLGWGSFSSHIETLAHDEAQQVRVAATQALAELSPLQHRFVLRMACHDSSDEVRAAALTSFQYEMQPVDARRLFWLLGDRSELVRQSAMQVLIKGVNERVLSVYEKHATDFAALPGRVATIGLANQGDTRALERLPEIIRSSEDMQLPAAAYVLASQERAAAQALKEQLAEEAREAHDEKVFSDKMRAVEALERSLEVTTEQDETTGLPSRMSAIQATW